MLPVKEALHHHVDCMGEWEAAVWLGAMEAFLAEDGAQVELYLHRLRGRGDAEQLAAQIILSDADGNVVWDGQGWLEKERSARGQSSTGRKPKKGGISSANP